MLRLTTMVLALATLQPAFADQREQEIASEVTTEGTDFDGKRHSKTSDWSKVTAPDGYVMNKDATKTEMISENGSENRVEIEWKDEVEVIDGTGIKLPRTVWVRTHARSPKSNYPGHNHNARGWTKAKVKVVMTKYK